MSAEPRLSDTVNLTFDWHLTYHNNVKKAVHLSAVKKMGTNQPTIQLEGEVNMTRQDQIPCNKQQPKFGSRDLPVRGKKASSVHAVKKRIRDIKRRHEHYQNLPANIKVEDKRALAVCQQGLATALEEKARQKLIKRYHMVRFFGTYCFNAECKVLCLYISERQKASRKIKKLHKLLLEAKTTDEAEDIKAQMHIAEVDLNYTQYFPLSEPYVGLYPRASVTDQSSGQAGNAQAKPEMWAVVEKSMKDGTLDQLRNRKRRDAASFESQAPLSASALDPYTETPRNVSKINTHTGSLAKRRPGASRPTTKDDEGHESDLGFFEE
jgi:hypothetical protein